jgi:hypothetical protein
MTATTRLDHSDDLTARPDPRASPFGWSLEPSGDLATRRWTRTRMRRAILGAHRPPWVIVSEADLSAGVAKLAALHAREAAAPANGGDRRRARAGERFGAVRAKQALVAAGTASGSGAPNA